MPDATPDDVERLVADLAAARAAAEALAGRPALGLRAVETAAGRAYLCAFDGPRFLCLRADLTPEPSERRVRDAAAAGLLHERLEQMIDAAALRTLAEAAGRVIARGEDDGPVADALAILAQAALDLAGWREMPGRAVASLAGLDAASREHERVRAAYGAFVRASEPLVERQDELRPERVAALRAVEEAAGEAGVGDALARRLGAAMDDAQEGAAQVAGAHIAPLGP